MYYDIAKALEPFPRIQRMLEGIPEELWPIFLPRYESGLSRLEDKIVLFEKRQRERDFVMNIQRLCDLPLRPNASPGEMRAIARLEGKKKDRLLDRFRQEREED
jgi:hypothetical protein